MMKIIKKLGTIDPILKKMVVIQRAWNLKVWMIIYISEMGNAFLRNMRMIK